jgi:RNA polymerase sigma-70 factor, ECF subfamily
MHDFAEAGRAAHPGVVVDTDAFERHLQAVGAADPAHAADLYLAFAAARGSEAALARFDRMFLSEVGTFIARFDASAAFADEVRQLVAERLCVGPSPRLFEYAGRGPLRGFVRVAAVRTAIDLLRRRDELPLPDVERGAAPREAAPLDPELALVKARHQRDYVAALKAALARLTPKERNLLRMHFADQLSIDRIGVVYRVHRATAARWVQAAQARLLEETFAELRERLALDGAELASLTAVVHSQLDVTLSGLFRSAS